MILNVSGRTDIIAFYMDWFKNRLESGFVDVRNPFNKSLVSRIYLENVDAYMFCTKNPSRFLEIIDLIKKPFILHVTLTPYKKDIEPNVIDKKVLIEEIKKISSVIGSDNLYIRYDPIFLSEKYDVNYHLKAFDKLCNLLDGYVHNYIISFIDDYKNVRKNMNILKYRDFTEEDYKQIGIGFSESARKHDASVQTCFEERNLVEYGFKKGECLSIEMAYKLTGKVYKKWKARNCACAEMVDIGVYNTCTHFCKYCYANFDEKNIKENIKKHNKNSSLLIGELNDDDIIKERYK